MAIPPEGKVNDQTASPIMKMQQKHLITPSPPSHKPTVCIGGDHVNEMKLDLPTVSPSLPESVIDLDDEDDADEDLDKEIAYLQEKQLLLEKAMSAMKYEEGYDASKALDIFNGNVPSESAIWDQGREILEILNVGSDARRMKSRKFNSSSSMKKNSKDLSSPKIDFSSVVKKSSTDIVFDNEQNTEKNTHQQDLKHQKGLSDGIWWARAMANSFKLPAQGSTNPSFEASNSGNFAGNVSSQIVADKMTVAAAPPPQSVTKPYTSTMTFSPTFALSFFETMRVEATSMIECQVPSFVNTDEEMSTKTKISKQKVKFDPIPPTSEDINSTSTKKVNASKSKKRKASPKQEPKKKIQMIVGEVPVHAQSKNQQGLLLTPQQEQEHRLFVQKLDQQTKKSSSKSAGSSSGRWTAVEHQLFLDGLEKFGKSWNEIAIHIKSRSIVQVRTHAQKYFQKLAQARKNGDEGEISMVPRGGYNKRRRRGSKGGKKPAKTPDTEATVPASSPEKKNKLAIAIPSFSSPDINMTKIAGPQVHSPTTVCLPMMSSIGGTEAAADHSV